MHNIVATIMPNGNLRLAADEETREAARELREEMDDVQALITLMEPHWTNGGYQPFDGGMGNPFVGLTSAPCIAESMDVTEEGESIIVGRLWSYSEYALSDMVEHLADHGFVIFTKAQ